MDSHKIEEAAADWLARRDSGNWSAADESALHEWLEQSTSHRVTLLRLQTLWQGADRLRALGAGIPTGTVPPPGQWQLSPFATRGTRTPISIPSLPSSGVRGAFKLAAGIAVAVVLATLLFVSTHESNSYRTQIGHIEALPLDDGSHVTLNTDSSIRIALTERERRVELDRGEAFFEVAKDPSRPFVVHAGERRIVAVGTQFSVRRSGNEVQVIVTEGKVRVESGQSSANAAFSTQLTAGSIARAGAAGVLVTQQPVPKAEEYLAWRSGYLVFRETLLAEAVAEFNRYNIRQLVIADAQLADLRIGGSLRATNLSAFVRVLEQGFPVRATEEGDRIVLTAR